MSKKFLSGFWLKIIGFITMTFDHLGVFLQMFVPSASDVASIFRIIGRIAFPIFVFLLVEGIRHTKNFGKYITRLLILAVPLILFEVVVYYNIYNGLDFPSPINDLVFIALAIYLLNRKDKFSFLSILPIGYLILCFVIEQIEFQGKINVEFLPFFVRCDYNIFGLVLALGFYYSDLGAKLFLKSNENTVQIDSEEMIKKTSFIVSGIWVVIVASLCYLTNRIFGSAIFSSITIWAGFAFIPLMLYNGKRGYNAKWFQYGSYAYFPLHLIILFAIFYFLGYISL